MLLLACITAIVIKGIKREQLQRKSPRQYLPITADIMANIYTTLAHTPNDPHCVMIWAACCIAFFGFLRCSEFTIPIQQKFDLEVHLTLNDIAINNKSTPSVVCFIIKQSKIDPFRQGVDLFLGITCRSSSVSCQEYITIPGLER